MVINVRAACDCAGTYARVDECACTNAGYVVVDVGKKTGQVEHLAGHDHPLFEDPVDSTTSPEPLQNPVPYWRYGARSVLYQAFHRHIAVIR